MAPSASPRGRRPPISVAENGIGAIPCVFITRRAVARQDELLASRLRGENKLR